MWFLDTNYNGLCFHVNQAFFPRTKAWDSLKKALKGTYEESVWEHLSGTISAPFDKGEHHQIAVKVIQAMIRNRLNNQLYEFCYKFENSNKLEENFSIGLKGLIQFLANIGLSRKKVKKILLII